MAEELSVVGGCRKVKVQGDAANKLHDDNNLARGNNDDGYSNNNLHKDANDNKNILK